MRHLQLLIIIPLIVALFMFNGLVFQDVWEWFLLPLGAPSITLPQSLGILLLIGFPLRHVARTEYLEDVKGYVHLWTVILIGLAGTLIFWGTAALVNLFN